MLLKITPPPTISQYTLAGAFPEFFQTEKNHSIRKEKSPLERGH